MSGNGSRHGLLRSRRKGGAGCFHIYSGFTLLELAVVVAILVILAAVALPAYSRGMARLKLKLAAVTLVQDFRDMQTRAVGEGSFHTIVFITDQNRYYYREGTQAWAPPGAFRVERRLSRDAGFPLAAGTERPVSAIFGTQSTRLSPIVTMSFNENGRPAGAAGGGHVTLVTPYGDRLDVIVTPVDGLVHMEWIH